MALEFTDSHAGSGKAVHGNGFYMVIPLHKGGFDAKFSDGKNWIWEGGEFTDPVNAEQACRTHAGETSI